MSSTKIRIEKEARALFWPWCVVIATIIPNVLPWLRNQSFPFGDLSFWGLCIGVPLLATLSLGNEFQYGTLPLLLSQPIERRKLWDEKALVLLAATLSVVFVYALGPPAIVSEELGPGLAAVLLITGCSAMFWTLIARSTMEGMVLNALQIFALIPLVDLTKFRFEPGTAIVWAPLILVYSSAMLLLGRRSLERYQASGRVDTDLTMLIPNSERSLTLKWLQCRPSDPILNLIRKEVRLLFPVWLLTGLVTILVALLAGFGGLSGDLFDTRHSRLVNASHLLLVVLLPLIAILAGSLSLGEERTRGTHLWNLTIPVSMRTQWLIKAFVATIPGPLLLAAPAAIAALVLPDALNPGQFLYVLVFAGPPLSLLSFTAFWCASSVKNAVSAALWVFPVLGGIITAYALGKIGSRSYWSTPVLDFVILRLHPFPFLHSTANIIGQITIGGWQILEFVPLLLLAVFQTYRLFRTEVRDGVRPLLRCWIAVAGVIFVSAFLIDQVWSAVGITGNLQQRIVIHETAAAIDKMKLDPMKLDAGHPLEVTLADLVKIAPVSDITRRWLDGSTITITPGDIRCNPWQNGKWTPEITETYPFLITIHYRNNLSFSWAGPNGAFSGPQDRAIGPCTGPRQGFHEP